MDRKKRRISRVRRKLSKKKDRLRLSVFRSARHIYAQVIDDSKGITVAAASSQQKEIAEQIGKAGGNIDAATVVGQVMGETLNQHNITAVAFDRGGFQYHGRIKALADSVRACGIRF